MRNILFLFSVAFLISCGSHQEDEKNPNNNFSSLDYRKEEVYITMRDGIKLFTTIYTPKDTTQVYPVLIKRTPYSCRPYGDDTIPENIMHNPDLIASGYIFIFQDTRGRWMSEGDFENVKPPYSLEDRNATDEITDAYDTFDWIADNVNHFNGNIGMYGNSYPGWTTLVGATSNHPNLKAVMAMAPVTNFYFEDFNRYGLFALNYLPVLNAFGAERDGPTKESWYEDNDSIFYEDKENDIMVPYYDFFQERLALTNYDDILGENYFWKEIKSHPNYDKFHKKRDWIQYLDSINCQVMIVGGWNDEQNLYGILNSYKRISQTNKNSQFVMGPWSHGHNKKRDSLYYLGNVCFGRDISKDFQENVEFNYFEYHLKGNGQEPDFRVKLFDTGKKEWKIFNEFPNNETENLNFYILPYGELANAEIPNETTRKFYQEFTSDPFNPVPYLEENDFHRMAPKSYFTDDQRFLEGRKDVLSYVSQPFTEDVTVLGEIKALIEFATNMEDADIYVKIIDVYPEDRVPEENDIEGINYKGYQQLVRCGYIRGRYRNGFEVPIPFEKNKQEIVQVPLLEIFHTFKKGHSLMVQIQSSMFPLFDMNPQKYIESIYNAENKDFKKAVHRIYYNSKIILPILKE